MAGGWSYRLDEISHELCQLMSAVESTWKFIMLFLLVLYVLEIFHSDKGRNVER